MMYDLFFDISTREIVFENGDFKTTSNPSTQNGGIMLYSRVSNAQAVMNGVGIEEIMNGDTSKANYELNRWKSQSLSDGATLAKFSISNVNNDITIKTQISYE